MKKLLPLIKSIILPVVVIGVMIFLSVSLNSYLQKGKTCNYSSDIIASYEAGKNKGIGEGKLKVSQEVVNELLSTNQLKISDDLILVPKVEVVEEEK